MDNEADEEKELKSQTIMPMHIEMTARKVKTAVTVIDEPVVPEKTSQEWADAVTRKWRKSVEAILTVGWVLIRAKFSVSHGNFAKMFRDHRKPVERPIPMSQHTAELLMKIAGHDVLADSTHWVDLPSSWRTLAELARIEPRDMKTYLKLGRIYPEMTRVEVTALIIRKQAPTTSRGTKPNSGRPYDTPYRSDDMLHRAQETMRNVANQINRELTAPLMIGDDGHILSGVVWLPPFTQPLSIKARPIKVKHRCECGHLHDDRSKNPAIRPELRPQRCTVTEELNFEAPPGPM